jgi:hypothetical protein
VISFARQTKLDVTWYIGSDFVVSACVYVPRRGNWIARAYVRPVVVWASDDWSEVLTEPVKGNAIAWHVDAGLNELGGPCIVDPLEDAPPAYRSLLEAMIDAAQTAQALALTSQLHGIDVSDHLELTLALMREQVADLSESMSRRHRRAWRAKQNESKRIRAELERRAPWIRLIQAAVSNSHLTPPTRAGFVYWATDNEEEDE